MKVRNTFIIFLVSGFWHGANWTFIVWGGLNSLYFLPLLLLKRNRINVGVVAEGRILPGLRELWQMGTTFLLTVLAWVFFRAESVHAGFSFLGGTLDYSIFESPNFAGRIGAAVTIIFIFFMVLVEWINKDFSHSFERPPKNKAIRYIVYYLLAGAIFQNMGGEQQFIYFQF